MTGVNFEVGVTNCCNVRGIEMIPLERLIVIICFPSRVYIPTTAILGHIKSTLFMEACYCMYAPLWLRAPLTQPASFQIGDR